jgi:hypothetical protein
MVRACELLERAAIAVAKLIVFMPLESSLSSTETPSVMVTSFSLPKKENRSRALKIEKASRSSGQAKQDTGTVEKKKSNAQFITLHLA